MRKIGRMRRKKISGWSNLLVSLILIVFFLITYFLQVNVFSNLTIAGVKPNLFVIYILIIGLFGNNFLVILFGTLSGLFIDMLYGEVIGITPAMFCLIGFMATWFDSLWSKDEKISIVIMVIISTFIFELGSSFLRSVLLGFEMEMGPFLRIMLLEELYNVLLTIIFFGLIKKFGYSIERKLKRNNMYTVEL